MRSFRLLLNRISQSKLIREIEVPIEKIRSWGGRKLIEDVHPIIKAINDFKSRGIIYYNKSSLQSFVLSNSPIDACQTLGLEKDEAPGLIGLHPVSARYPWEKFSPFISQWKYKKTLWNELKIKHSLGDNLTLHQNLRGEAEFKRIINVYKNLQLNGFDQKISSLSPISGQILKSSNGNWVILIRNGEHRVAALKELGFTKIKVNINVYDDVNLEEIHNWPHVVKGIITPQGASKVFQGIYEGKKNTTLVNVVGWP